MEEYLSNFIKAGNPNGEKSSKWPAANSDKSVPVIAWFKRTANRIAFIPFSTRTCEKAGSFVFRFELLACATHRAESADADIEMTRRKAFPAILRLRGRSYRKPIEVQWKALRALRTAAARAQSYSHPGHRSRQSDRRIHSFVWRQSLLPLVSSGRAEHPDRPRCS